MKSKGFSRVVALLAILLGLAGFWVGFFSLLGSDWLWDIMSEMLYK